MADGPIEAWELERAADWRIGKLGVDPADAQSAAAAKLLQKLADDLRRIARLACLHRVSRDLELAWRVRCDRRVRGARELVPGTHRDRAVSARRRSVFASADRAGERCRGAVGPPTNDRSRARRESLSAARIEAFRHHFVRIRTEAGSHENAVERRPHQPLPRGVVAPPLTERLHQTGRGRWIRLVERQHFLGEKGVARAAAVVEMQRVGLRKCADQRPHPVRVGAREGRVGGQFTDPLDRAGQ